MMPWTLSCFHRRPKTSGGPILMVSPGGSSPRLWASMTATLSAKRAQEESKASTFPVARETSSRPKCRTGMINMVVHGQSHIEYECCSTCHGVFFDAGEFRDFKEETILDFFRNLRAKSRR